MKVKIKKIYVDSRLPVKMSEKAGAYDIYCHSIEVKNNLYICKTGVAMTPPEGYRICLVPRSSLSNYNWVLGNHFGIGDEDYTGEYQFRFRPIPRGIYSDSSFESDYANTHHYIKTESTLEFDEFPFKPGDRIGQIFLEKVIPIEFEEVEELSITERSTGGYGSTGL